MNSPPAPDPRVELLAQLKDEIKALGRRIGEITVQQQRIAVRYGDDAALAHDAEYDRLHELKQTLGAQYQELARRHDRLQEELDP